MRRSSGGGDDDDDDDDGGGGDLKAGQQASQKGQYIDSRCLPKYAIDDLHIWLF